MSAFAIPFVSFGSGQVSGAASPLTFTTAGPQSDPSKSISSADTPWWQTLINTGAQVGNTILGYELQKQQISRGQTPSVGYSPVGSGNPGAPTGQSVPAIQVAQTLPGAQGTAASLFGATALGGLSIGTLLIILVVVLLLMRRH